MRKILSVVLLLSMLVSLFSVVAYAEEESAFVSESYETTLGENVEIELKATDSVGVIAMLCEVVFDQEYLEVLRYDDAKPIGGTLTAKTDESGKIRKCTADNAAFIHPADIGKLEMKIFVG